MSANYWVAKKSGSKEIKVSNKCLSQKKIRSKTICGPENVGPKKCWVQQNVSWSQKKFGF